MTYERQLKYFQMYTKSNCELECLSNYTMGKCGCVKFSMIRDATMPICGIPFIPCYNTAIKEFEYQTLKRNPNHVIAKCNCMVGCNYVKYDFTFSETDYNITKLLPVNLTIETIQSLGFVTFHLILI